MPFNPQPAKHPDKPLRGQRILVTRASEIPCRLTNLIELAGGEVLLHPVIEMAPVDDPEVLDNAISGLKAFQWIVFASPTGVRFFFERLKSLGHEIREEDNLRFAAIGRVTADSLKQIANVDVDLVPENSNSEFLAEAMVRSEVKGKLLIVRANRGSDELGRLLTQAKIDFEEVAAYQSLDVRVADPAIVGNLESGSIDWVTITSSAIARSAIGLFHEALKKSKSVSISPTTTKEMVSLGFSPDCEALQYNFDGLVTAMIEAT